MSARTWHPGSNRWLIFFLWSKGLNRANGANTHNQCHRVQTLFLRRGDPMNPVRSCSHVFIIHMRGHSGMKSNRIARWYNANIICKAMGYFDPMSRKKKSFGHNKWQLTKGNRLYQGLLLGQVVTSIQCTYMHWLPRFFVITHWIRLIITALISQVSEVRITVCAFCLIPAVQCTIYLQITKHVRSSWTKATNRRASNDVCAVGE